MRVRAEADQPSAQRIVPLEKLPVNNRRVAARLDVGVDLERLFQTNDGAQDLVQQGRVFAVIELGIGVGSVARNIADVRRDLPVIGGRKALQHSLQIAPIGKILGFSLKIGLKITVQSIRHVYAVDNVVESKFFPGFFVELVRTGMIAKFGADHKADLVPILLFQSGRAGEVAGGVNLLVGDALCQAVVVEVLADAEYRAAPVDCGQQHLLGGDTAVGRKATVIVDVYHAAPFHFLPDFAFYYSTKCGIITNESQEVLTL